MKLKNSRFIDLFAGIGGFHQALSKYDSSCVFASEWDKEASRVYAENYGIKPHGDITEIHESTIPPHNILCAGFPCQAFSISGKQNGFNDTRGTLFFDIARIANYHKPEILFLENVKNLIRHDEGRTLKTITETLDNIGYNAFYKVLNASNFGLPQNRERLYFVCFRKNLLIKDFTFPSPLKTKISLKAILEEKPDIKEIKREDIFMNAEKVYLEEENIPNRPIQIGRISKGRQGERIYHPNGHAITLSAYGGGIGAKTGIYKVDNKLRKLTPRECARAQGFPESFKIISSNSQAYKQFGNSVAINVLDSILSTIEIKLDTINNSEPLLLSE